MYGKPIIESIKNRSVSLEMTRPILMDLIQESFYFFRFFGVFLQDRVWYVLDKILTCKMSYILVGIR